MAQAGPCGRGRYPEREETPGSSLEVDARAEGRSPPNAEHWGRSTWISRTGLDGFASGGPDPASLWSEVPSSHDE